MIQIHIQANNSREQKLQEKIFRSLYILSLTIYNQISKKLGFSNIPKKTYFETFNSRKKNQKFLPFNIKTKLKKKKLELDIKKAKLQVEKICFILSRLLTLNLAVLVVLAIEASIVAGYIWYTFGEDRFFGIAHELTYIMPGVKLE